MTSPSLGEVRDKVRVEGIRGGHVIRGGGRDSLPPSGQTFVLNVIFDMVSGVRINTDGKEGEATLCNGFGL